MNSTISAENWLLSSQENFNLLLQTQGSKWTKLTPEELRYLYTYTSDYAWYNDLMRISSISICSIGIFSATMEVITLFKKAFKEKNGFFQAMFVVSLINLFFSISYVVHSSLFRFYKVTGSTSYGAMWFTLINRSVVFSCSVASDLFALDLTIKRYIGLRWPHGLKHFSTLFANLVQVSVIVLLSLTRTHYSMSHIVKAAPLPADSTSPQLYLYETSVWSKWPSVIGLTLFSDMILPFILIVAMLLFSGLVVAILIKRRKKIAPKMNPSQTIAVTQAGTNQSTSNAMPQVESGTGRFAAWKPKSDKPKKESGDQTKTMIRFVLVLDALFILNELGYCVYAVAEFMLDSIPTIDFSTDYDRALYWVKVRRSAYVTVFLNIVQECLSHSFNFFLYLQFSTAFRVEFRALMSTVCTNVKASLSK